MLLSDLFSRILKSEEDTIKYLIEIGVLKEHRKCPVNKCRKVMVIVFDRTSFRCPSKSCRKELSIFKNSFFSSSNLEVRKILEIAYLYLFHMPIKFIITSTGVYSESICAWTSFIRQACADAIDYEHVRIGGMGVIVEIDETKLGKRKYHRGHRVDGVWVLVGVERTADKKIFCVELPDRSAETLKTLFEIYVIPGSIVYTDGWAAYRTVCLELGFEHHVVNHSENFKDPEHGTHTNTVEGCNNALKILIKPQNRVKKNINDHLYYFIWRRQNSKNIYNSFLKVLKEILYD